jgi:hypothetical protein
MVVGRSLADPVSSKKGANRSRAFLRLKERYSLPFLMSTVARMQIVMALSVNEPTMSIVLASDRLGRIPAPTDQLEVQELGGSLLFLAPRQLENSIYSSHNSIPCGYIIV